MHMKADIHPTGFSVSDFTTDKPPFTAVRIQAGDGEAVVFLNTTRECDELIKAASEAKALLAAVRQLGDAR